MPKYHPEIQQGTDAWLEKRLGKFTASDFHIMLGKSQTKIDKLWEIVAERMLGDTDQEPYSSYAMERGKILEVEARRTYAFANEILVDETGFVEPDEDNPWFSYVGCSPDGLVGEDGLIEIKCLPGDVEVLTSKGYKPIKNLTKRDVVCECNKDGKIEWHKPQYIINKPYDGELIVFYRHNKLQLKCTPDHRVLYTQIRDGKNRKTPKVCEAKDFNKSAHSMRFGGNVAGKNTLTAEQKLWIAIKADGHRTSSRSVVFNFSKERKINRLKQICKQANVGIIYLGGRDFNSTKWNSSKYFRVTGDGLGNIKNKSFFDLFDVSSLNTSTAIKIIEEFCFWDGYVSDKGLRTFTSTNKDDVDFLQAVSCVANKPASITKVVNKGIHKGWMTTVSHYGAQSKSCSDWVSFSSSKNKPDTIRYTGRVYCIGTKNGFFVTRTGTGLNLVVGNCPLAKNFLQWTEPGENGREVKYIKPEYYTQIMFNLMVTERKWCDFCYYHPRVNLVVKRYYPDPEHIAKIKAALDECIKFVKEKVGEC